MDPLSQTHLYMPMNISSGNPSVTIGVIDGPVDLAHPAFTEAGINTVKRTQIASCRDATSVSCLHGNFVVGILSAKRGLTAPGICPNCRVMLYPIFKEMENKAIEKGAAFPSATPEELSTAIIATIDAGAKIINLSLGLSTFIFDCVSRLARSIRIRIEEGCNYYSSSW